jgi:YVTN family beta-propeller protein
MIFRATRKLSPLIFFIITTLSLSSVAISAPKEKHVDEQEKGGITEMITEEKEAEKTTGPVSERITRKGIVVEFSAKPTAGRSLRGDEIFEGDFVDLAFRITDAGTGEPIQGQFPGVWMDMGELWSDRVKKPGAEKNKPMDCKERVGLYLQGLVGIRPMIDLNSYYLLVLNRDPTIAVIDPVVGIKGITNLYAQIILKRAGADWTITKDQRRLFVSMPVADMVAVVDTDTFRLTHNVSAGNNPVRIRFQPDERYLWVGNDTRKVEESGVTVIDADTLEGKGFIRTGKGHHEIAFTGDSRYAFVGNRDEGTVTVIDIATLKKVKDIETGTTPISLAYSALSRALYVADGKDGTITVIDGQKHDITTRIPSKPGLGPMGFSQDGRWAVVVNSLEDAAYVIDPSTNRITDIISVGDEPYQVAFSRSFAYVRSLGTERVSMINLSELGKEDAPPVTTFPAGQTAPKIAKDISMANTIVEAPGEAAVMVVSPADDTVYYYMEGMNAPMGNFRNYGHRPRAVQVVDRSMQEREPGTYGATIRVPEAGTYDVAFLFESPSILNCFKFTARKNPELKRTGPSLDVEYLIEERTVRVGETVKLRFKLTDSASGKPQPDLKGVSVLHVMAPGTAKVNIPARHVGEGVYEAPLPVPRTGSYFVYVGCASKNVKHTDLPFLTLVASPEKAPK